jgi:hypothetical protein
MVTQLFRSEFLATECRLTNLNILRAACQKMLLENSLMAIKQPYSGSSEENRNSVRFSGF